MKRKVAVVLLVILALLLAIQVVSAQSPSQEVQPAGLTPTPEPPTLTPTSTAIPSPTPTNTPTPTATPDKWDKSSIKVEGACKEGVPTFNIYNAGSNMQGTSRYWFINGHASASTCAEIPEDPALGGGEFQLPADGSVDVFFPKGDLQPPYSICVAQRQGHPGTGYAASTIENDAACATAEEVVDEPVAGRKWLLFLPKLMGQ